MTSGVSEHRPSGRERELRGDALATGQPKAECLGGAAHESSAAEAVGARRSRLDPVLEQVRAREETSQAS